MATFSAGRAREDILVELQDTHTRLRALERELNINQEGSHPQDTQYQSNANGLELSEYVRYGRQLLLPSIGLPGQVALKQARILVIGAGGLGCPVLLYLGAAGVGHITIFDHDMVEMSNLHRQVLHTENRIGMPKAISAKIGLMAVNSQVEVEAHTIAFTPEVLQGGVSSISKANFTAVADCSDNATTRHFINAYCAAHSIPLISGGAVRTDGVVGVYNVAIEKSLHSSGAVMQEVANVQRGRGPCYACIFPPTTEEEVSTDEEHDEIREEQTALYGTGACSDEGVLGILCGFVGLSMCSEMMKVILGFGIPTLHLISPLSGKPFQTLKMRPKKPTCPTCSSPGTILNEYSKGKKWNNPHCNIVGVGEQNRMSSMQPQVTVTELAALIKEESPARIIDVRNETEYGICHLTGSINIPFRKLLGEPQSALVGSELRANHDKGEYLPIYFICRRGNESFLAARMFRRYLKEKVKVSEDEKVCPSTDEAVFNVKGGLVAWNGKVDSSFPVY